MIKKIKSYTQSFTQQSASCQSSVTVNNLQFDFLETQNLLKFQLFVFLNSLVVIFLQFFFNFSPIHSGYLLNKKNVGNSQNCQKSSCFRQFLGFRWKTKMWFSTQQFSFVCCKMVILSSKKLKWKISGAKCQLRDSVASSCLSCLGRMCLPSPGFSWTGMVRPFKRLRGQQSQRQDWSCALFLKSTPQSFCKIFVRLLPSP